MPAAKKFVVTASSINAKRLSWGGSLCVAIGLATLWFSGCSSLSSLGLPFSPPPHRILDSAKKISDAPGEAPLVPIELAKQPLETYRVEIGDTVFVEPVSFDATIRLPGDQVVKPDGTISIGEFGDFRADYKTIAEIQSEVQAIIDSQVRSEMERVFYEELYREQQADKQSSKTDYLLDDPDREEKIAAEERAREQEGRAALEKRISEQIRKNQIGVRLVNWNSKRIYVLGEVNAPGYFDYTGSQTVLDAIVEAGGLSSGANGHQIIVSRPTPCDSCRIVMKVCYDQVVQLGDTSTNYQLLPGDRVFVPSLSFSDHVKRACSFKKDLKCPRCSAEPQGCDLPTGCQ